MATAAVEAHPGDARDDTTITQDTAIPSPVIDKWETPESAPHPLAADIVRQVEFYFSDDNLAQDAHLLGLIKEGKGSVKLNDIMSFKKMRQYKPRAAVREALRQSTLVEVLPDGKRLRRKLPLGKRMSVLPKVNENRLKKVVPEDKPWLTKNMLKPTGFEEYMAEGPVKPLEYAQDCQDYDTAISFTQRIETAVTRFTARRKMHQQTRAIFSKFMIFGGMEGGQHMFTGGGLTDKDMEGLSKQEIAERSAYFGVSERVMDGFFADDGKRPTYIVDFEAVTKGFLSSQFMVEWNWYNVKNVITATNVVRNFFNYLLLHDVCSEYNQQLMAARKVCDVAEKEFPKLAEVDQRMPGGFNMACSKLFGGIYASALAQGDWVTDEEQYGWTMTDAKKVFLAGVAAYGSDEQLNAVEQIITEGGPFKEISTEHLGIEIVGIDSMYEEAKQVYADPRLTDTFVKPMGLLRCVRWEVPHAPPKDLPKLLIEASKTKEFKFLIEEETLKFCYPGLKMEVCVKELDVGIKWIDYLETSYASFFTWLMNETIREWKEPGPPRAWMRWKAGSMEMVPARAVDEHEAAYDDDEPD